LEKFAVKKEKNSQNKYFDKILLLSHTVTWMTVFCMSHKLMKFGMPVILAICGYRQLDENNPYGSLWNIDDAKARLDSRCTIVSCEG
jgi:hypothetical protein